jgi:hypothetical protein
MKTWLVYVCVAAMAAATVGCSSTAAPAPPTTEKEFQKLYKQYSARFYERMTTPEGEKMPPEKITAEAAKVWEEVFGPHKDLLAKRVEEILKDLDAAPAIQEDLYTEVATAMRKEPPPEQPQGAVMKQFLWSPVGAAQMGLNNWLSQLLQQQSFALRNIMTANASLLWETVDRNPDHPKLELRQGSMIYMVDLTRKDDYYQVDRIRWMRPKSMGPVAPATRSTTGGVPEAPATGTPATKPAAAPAAAPPAKPATPPAKG